MRCLWLCRQASESKRELSVDPQVAAVYKKALEARQSRFHAIVSWLKVCCCAASVAHRSGPQVPTI